MAYKITSECTNCGSCVGACPAEAIKEGDSQHCIDADACVDCGVCVGECPVEAIVEV